MHEKGTGRKPEKERRNRIVHPARTLAQVRGERAERFASEHLARNGLITIARNVRCRGGEIDLICRDRDTVVFVEVRLRTNPNFGGAAASIGARKRGRILLAARWWLNGAGRAHSQRPCRFDVIAVDGVEPHEINWIKSAFDASEC